MEVDDIIEYVAWDMRMRISSRYWVILVVLVVGVILISSGCTVIRDLRRASD